MNIVHEPKTVHSVIDHLINSGAIAGDSRLGLDDFESHARHPELISTSLTTLGVDSMETLVFNSGSYQI